MMQLIQGRFTGSLSFQCRQKATLHQILRLQAGKNRLLPLQMNRQQVLQQCSSLSSKQAARHLYHLRNTSATAAPSNTMELLLLLLFVIHKAKWLMSLESPLLLVVEELSSISRQVVPLLKRITSRYIQPATTNWRKWELTFNICSTQYPQYQTLFFAIVSKLNHVKQYVTIITCSTSQSSHITLSFTRISKQRRFFYFFH